MLLSFSGVERVGRGNHIVSGVLGEALSPWENSAPSLEDGASFRFEPTAWIFLIKYRIQA